MRCMMFRCRLIFLTLVLACGLVCTGSSFACSGADASVLPLLTTHAQAAGVSIAYSASWPVAQAAWLLNARHSLPGGLHTA